MIVCQARTGSTALATALIQHKQIAGHGEVFGGPRNPNAQINIFGVQNKLKPPFVKYLRNLRNSDPVQFWTEILMVNSSEYKATGLKFKYEELDHPQWAKLVDYIAGDQTIRIISLKRENLLDRELSEHMALNVTRLFNTRDSNYKHNSDPVVLDEKKLQAGFERSYQLQEKYDELFKNHPGLNLTYNDIALRGEDTFRRVQEFLGVDFQVINALTKKLQKEPASECIANYDDLKTYFSGSDYSQFFA